MVIIIWPNHMGSIDEWLVMRSGQKEKKLKK